MNRTNLWPFLTILINPFMSFETSILDKVGSKTVPIAIANMPIGN